MLSLLLVSLSAPPEFIAPQSPPKPTPFTVRLVDQGWHDPRLKGLMAPEGFRVEIVAEAPVVVNPTGMAFAPDGTLFVAEWTVDPVIGGRWFEFKETFRYHDGTTKQVATMRKFVTDPIKVLKWNRAKQVYDKAETIIAEEIPSTLLWHDGWLYTASRGTVRRYRQSRPGGAWDIRETIAQGFCGFHHHQVSGLTIGNDGKLYITSGDDDNFAEGSDGSRATVLRTGAVFRCNPDGSQLETYSLGYRNPYRDLAHDDRFNFFHADNDNEDGSKFTGCRLMHVAEGIDYGWRLKIGARCCRPDVARGAVAGELPGKLPPMLKTGRGAPAGLLIYHDTKIPEPYRGLLYYPDVFRKLVRAYKVAPRGASFEVTHEFEFLKSDDPLFRPCQMITGPDGAIYVCDWRTDSGGAGRLSGDGKHGRIYRMTWTGTADRPAIMTRGLDSWAELLKLPTAKLIDRLDAPDLTDRVEARKELIRRGAPARDAVLRRYLAGRFTADGRLVALGVLQAHWSPKVEDFFRLLLEDESPDVRRMATEALALHGPAHDERNHAAIAPLLRDGSAAVRRAAALSLARIGADKAAILLADAWQTDDGTDPFLADAYLRGIERLGEPALRRVLDGKLERAVKAFTACRSEAAAAMLPELLNHPKLSLDQRADLVRSYANYQFDPAISLEPLADFVTKHKEPAIAIAALDVYAVSAPLDGKSTAWMIAQLDADNVEVRLAALRAIELAQVAAAEKRLAEALADPKRSTVERAAVLKALRTTAGAAAIGPLADLLSRDAPAALKVEALRALALAAPEKARTLAAKLLDQTDLGLLGEAVAVLGATKDGARLVGERYAARRLPKELYPRVSDAVKKYSSDPAMAALQTEVLKGSLLLKLDAARAAEITKLVASKGNPTRGKAIYFNTSLTNCATCHKLEGIGGSVGPDLSRIWDTQSTAKILETIIEPSKEIKEGYQSYTATTADGRTITGLKVTDTSKEVTLRDAQGRDVRIPREDLDDLSLSKSSLMPEDSVSRLSLDQLLDLLAFLKDRAAQESLRGTVLEYAVASAEHPLGVIESVEVKPKPETWQVKAADPDGRLHFSPLLTEPDASVYVRTYLFSPKPQTVTVKLSTDDDARLMVGGRRFPIANSPKKAVQGPVEIAVPAGWTSLLLKLSGSGKDRTLGLQVLGEDVRTAGRRESR